MKIPIQQLIAVLCVQFSVSSVHWPHNEQKKNCLFVDRLKDQWKIARNAKLHLHIYTNKKSISCKLMLQCSPVFNIRWMLCEMLLRILHNNSKNENCEWLSSISVILRVLWWTYYITWITQLAYCNGFFFILRYISIEIHSSNFSALWTLKSIFLLLFWRDSTKSNRHFSFEFRN